MATKTNFPSSSGGSGSLGGSVRIVTASGAVTMVSTDSIVQINKTVGDATAVATPVAPLSARVYTVKDGKGDAGTNNITITPTSGLFDGAANYVINSNYGAISFYWDGTNYYGVA